MGAGRPGADPDDHPDAAAAGQGGRSPTSQAALDKAGPDTLVIGLGRDGKPVTISLHGDSPHLGLSMGPGAGKSVTARFLAAQMAYKGAVLLVPGRQADLAHVGAAGCRTSAYARDDDEIHAALLWLAGEVHWRNRVADKSADIEGNVTATSARASSSSPRN